MDGRRAADERKERVRLRYPLMPGLTMQLTGTPLVNNIGRQVGVMPASRAFPDATRPVHYYAPNNYTPNQ